MTPPELHLVRRTRRSWTLRLGVLGLVLAPVVAAVAIGAVVLGSSARIGTSPDAIARISLPVGGGRIASVAATVGVEGRDLPVHLEGREVWPDRPVPAGVRVQVVAVVRRPGWNAWLAGGRSELRLTLVTPRPTLRDAYVTVAHGAAIPVRFSMPVMSFGSSADPARVRARALGVPSRRLSVTPTGVAGTLYVAAAARRWERPSVQAISWFPAGAAATAVASPAPGQALGSRTPITLTFSTPVATALGGQLPRVTPVGAGGWVRRSEHTIEFVPSGYGYGVGARVSVALPAGVHLIGGTGDPVGLWRVAPGSTTRLQELLAGLGYLPVSFTPSGPPVGADPAAQEAAAIHPPGGSFAWRWATTPPALRAQWQPGAAGELTRAAVMSFENAEGLTPDGEAGPAVWKALFAATAAHRTNPSGYTFVTVHEAASGETEQTWHDGRTVVQGPVNTGVAAAGGTAPGVFAVFEHLSSTTMTGVNPDGSHYSDPGIPDVSYFNGGDALHGFHRPSYGTPQSDGCVEMPYGEAARVYPYTPIGTVVDVTTG